MFCRVGLVSSFLGSSDQGKLCWKRKEANAGEWLENGDRIWAVYGIVPGTALLCRYTYDPGQSKSLQILGEMLAGDDSPQTFIVPSTSSTKVLCN